MQQDNKRISRPVAIWLTILLIVVVIGIALSRHPGVKSKSLAAPPATPTLHYAKQQVLAEIDLYATSLAEASSEEEEVFYQAQLNQTYTIATRFWAPTRTQQETDARATSVQEMLLAITPRPTSSPAPTGTIESGPLFEANIPKEVALGNLWQGYVDGLLTLVYAGNLQIWMYQPGETTDVGIVYIMQRRPDGSRLDARLTTETMPVFWREPGFLHILDDYTEAGTLYLDIRGDNGETYALDLDAFELIATGAPP